MACALANDTKHDTEIQNRTGIANGVFQNLKKQDIVLNWIIPSHF